MKDVRRLAGLEAAPPAPPGPVIDPAHYRAWLATPSDDDLDLIVHVAEHVKKCGDLSALSVATLAAMARMLATWDTGQEGAGP